MTRRFLTLGVGRQKSFLPSDLPDLVLWLKADDGPDTPTDGSPVTTWSDKSGNGHDATQATAARKPTFYSTTRSINGKPVVYFEAAQAKWLDFGKPTEFASEIEAFAVVNTINNDAEQRFLSLQNDGTNPHRFVMRTYPGTSGAKYNVYAYVSNAGKSADISGEPSGTFLWSMTCKESDYLTPYKNGTAGTPTGVGSSFTSLDANSSKLGSARAGNGQYANGDIAEVVIYSRILTANQRVQVQNYLNDKYAIY